MTLGMLICLLSSRNLLNNVLYPYHFYPKIFFSVSAPKRNQKTKNTLMSLIDYSSVGSGCLSHNIKVWGFIYSLFFTPLSTTPFALGHQEFQILLWRGTNLFHQTFSQTLASLQFSPWEYFSVRH